MKRILTSFLATLLSGVAFCQPAFVGEGRFPQFRSYSGLPGGGFSIDRYGRQNPTGALAYSSPVAYSLAPWSVNLGVGAVSGNRSFTSLNLSGNTLNNGNGTSWLMIGLPGGKFGRFTVTYEMISSIHDSAFNFHWQLPVGNHERDNYSIAVGVQDAWGDGGSAGENLPTDGKSSLSLYAVYTRELNTGLHLSLGTGTRRFQGLFGSASYHFGNGLQFFAEHDSFNINLGIGYSIFAPHRNLDSFEDKRRPVGTVTIGLSRGTYIFGGLSFGF